MNNHPSQETNNTAHKSFHVSPHTTLTLPVVSLIAIVAACASGWAWLARTNERVTMNSRAIEALQAESAERYALLIRMDENLKWVREELSATRGKEGR